MDKHSLLDSLAEKNFSSDILSAFYNVKREDFMPEENKEMAYEDTALPIGFGQTISQPYTIALMFSLLDLKKGQKVLEIGSGSGYVLALLSELVGDRGRVFGVELVKELVEKSKENLVEYGKNIKVYNKNGIDGLQEQGPYDAIIISAAMRDIPEKIMSQLKTKGILVAPKGSRFEQEIVAIQRKSKTEFEVKKRLPGFIFVPFIEREGFP